MSCLILPVIYDVTISGRFLVQEKVLHRDKGDLVERFHLKRYWRAEQKIISGLKQIMKRETPEIEIDLNRLNS